MSTTRVQHESRREIRDLDDLPFDNRFSVELPADPDGHRRVLAVVAFLQE